MKNIVKNEIVKNEIWRELRLKCHRHLNWAFKCRLALKALIQVLIQHLDSVPTFFFYFILFLIWILKNNKKTLLDGFLEFFDYFQVTSFIFFIAKLEFSFWASIWPWPRNYLFNICNGHASQLVFNFPASFNFLLGLTPSCRIVGQLRNFGWVFESMPWGIWLASISTVGPI